MVNSQLCSLSNDPRFIAAISLFNAGDFFGASEEFEDLFFEAVRDEVPVVRAMLQVSVGCLHAERRQHRAALGRLKEALLPMSMITNSHGIDFAALRPAVERLMTQIRAGASLDWPCIGRL